ncbi:MAG: hypothetical protein IT581_20070, partial [Verrucomicrobiales bacterium]|nr:hypothetical protein [Verrucomicrobiales bacterium]
ESDLPDDPNGWGTYHRRITFVFGWVDNLTDATAGNIGTGGVAKFTRTGSTTDIVLTNITGWDESRQTTWMNDLKSIPEKTEGRIAVKGFIRCDTSTDLAVRRSSMLEEKQALLAGLEGAEGTLTRGTFSQVVRIDTLNAQVDQASNDIPFSFTARFTVWPEESSYATERFSVSEGTRREDGQTTVVFRGTIQAHSLAHAKARLGQLRTAVQGTYSGAQAIRVVSSDLDSSYISSGAKQITQTSQLEAGFVELQFNETWIVWNTVTQALSMEYTVRRRRDLVNSRIITEISGQLFASSTIVSNAAGYVAGNFIDRFYEAKGWKTKIRQDDRDIAFKSASGWTSGAATFQADRAQSLSFSATIEERLTGDNAIQECDVTESTTHSGVRWVEHKRPDGPSTFQDCGIESATHQISGTVRSASLSACMAFVEGKRKLLFAHANPEPEAGTVFEDPPSITTRYEWVPRSQTRIADAVREIGTVDVASHVVEFRFQERLPVRAF